MTEAKLKQLIHDGEGLTTEFKSCKNELTNDVFRMEFIGKHTLDRFFIIDNHRTSIRARISREIVSNILVHREYTSAFPAKIIIERERIVTENWSLPKNPGRITLENYTPYPKNPILARFFVNIGRADVLGSGVRNLYRFTKMYSGQEPEMIDGDVFRTIVPINLPEDAKATEDGIILSEKLGEKLGENHISIINLMQKNLYITIPEIADTVGISKTAVQNNIKKLKNKGLIERIGPDKGGYWKVI